MFDKKSGNGTIIMKGNWFDNEIINMQNIGKRKNIELNARKRIENEIRVKIDLENKGKLKYYKMRNSVRF